MKGRRTACEPAAGVGGEVDLALDVDDFLGGIRAGGQAERAVGVDDCIRHQGLDQF
jgi:hypothetical protein